jgi:8-oxo-dGTP pyrophosphatase MutT (NUDIX family)
VGLAAELALAALGRLPVPLARLGYRLAYRLAQGWWLVTRPRVVGVKFMLRDGDRVLLVRHAYGDRRSWEAPGGHARAGEPPAAAARREAHEELGVDTAAWREVGVLAATTDGKRETIHCFEAAWPPSARLRFAFAELEEARWVERSAPPPLGEVSARALALLS